MIIGDPLSLGCCGLEQNDRIELIWNLYFISFVLSFALSIKYKYTGKPNKKTDVKLSDLSAVVNYRVIDVVLVEHLLHVAQPV